MENLANLTFRHGKKRINGFSVPIHPSQALSSILYLVSTFLHILVCFIFPQWNGKWGIVITSMCLAALTISSWYVVSTINPEALVGDKHMPLWFGRKAPRITRLCLDCKKTILDFDHHCFYLNTCIGSKNYTSFIFLIVSGMVQMLFQLIISVLVQTTEITWETVQSLWLQVLLGLETVVSMIRNF
jgi:hypothetical protein